METLAIYPENMNKATKYALMSAAGEKLQNYAGQTINVTAYVLYENTDVKTGEVIGKRDFSKANFKLDVLDISIGLSIHL